METILILIGIVFSCLIVYGIFAGDANDDEAFLLWWLLYMDDDNNRDND